jgi:ATP10 protein
MRFWMLVLLAGGLVCLRAEQFPPIEGKNLLDQKTALPDAAAGRTAVIVIGFTHASQKQVKPWTTRLQHEFPTYSVAVLEDAPRLVRGMAVHGMKGGTPEDQRSQFIVIYHNEKELKQAAGFEVPDDAYVLLLDKDGAIRWRFHGPVTDTAVQELKSQALDVDHAVR